MTFFYSVLLLYSVNTQDKPQFFYSSIFYSLALFLTGTNTVGNLSASYSPVQEFALIIFFLVHTTVVNAILAQGNHKFLDNLKRINLF